MRKAVVFDMDGIMFDTERGVPGSYRRQHSGKFCPAIRAYDDVGGVLGKNPPVS